MAKLSEIKLPDNTIYEFKDSDAQDAIRHLADSTVSNLINITNIGSYVVDGVHISANSAGRVYIEGTATADISFLLSEDFFTTDAQSSCVLFTGDATMNGSPDTWWLELSTITSSYISYDETPTILPEMIMGGDLYLHIKSGTNLDGIGFYPMIIESALYNIGVRSGSYGPTNHDLYISLKFAQQAISKMNITAGSGTTPIYFDDGVPTPCTYTVEKSVPSDAVFTDTTYESKSAESGGTALSLVTTGEKYTWNNKQNTFSSSNKLNPSYINYDSTHRAVTDTEKSTWNGKQNALTFDSTPTSGSTNPVTSGGVYTALSSKADSTEIHALDTNITSSTTITAYVDALSKGHYATFYTSTSKPSDAPITDNCFVEIFIYSSSTAYIRVTPTATAYIGSTYELNKVSGTWQTQWVSHGYGMLIPDNTDINTITTVGDYFIGTGTSAETMTNLPASALFSGHLIVSGLNAVNKTRVMQTYIPSWNAADKTGKIFMRHLINTNQWTDWIMISDSALMAEVDAVANLGAKNLFDINAIPIVNHATYTLMNGKLTVNANGNWAHYSIPIELPKGDYILSTVISGYSKASGAPDTSMRIRVATSTSGGTNVVLETISQNGIMTIPFTWQGGSLYIQFYPNYNATSYANSFAAENVMLRPASISDSTYQPYAMNNADLTAAVQSVPVTELVDRDGKNLLANDSGTKTVGTITFTMNEDRSITVSGTSRTSNSDYNICTNMPLKAGTYVLSGCPSGGNNSSTYKIQINGVGYDIGDSYEFTLSADTNITVYIRIWSGYTPNNLVFRPMICTKSDWVISKAYVPSAFSNLELTQLHTGIQLSGTIDLDDFKSIGTWYGFNAVGNSAAHLPVPNGNFNIRLEVIMLGATYIRQKCMIARIDNLYTEFIRGYNLSASSPTWTEWQMMNTDGGYGWSLASGDDLNNINTVGTYQAGNFSISSTILNTPETLQPFRLEVRTLNARTNFVQELYTFNGVGYEPIVYRRIKTSGGWQPWIKITKDMPSTYELGTSLASNSDLNSLTTPGKWYATNATIADTISHNPVSGVAFFGETIPSVAGSRYIQILYPNDDTGDWYKRRYTGSWQKWIKYTGTPMS